MRVARGGGAADGLREREMSYDIRLRDADGETVCLDMPHSLRGGTYALGGTTEAWLNVTYNYSKHFYRVLGDKGIRSIYGMRAADSLPLLRAAVEKLSNDTSEDYWEATEGNAKQALMNLITLAEAAPEGIWDGD